LAQAQASRDSLSAVNLDEEAANLIRYQQAYQASAKAFQIGASLFDTILELAA
jgi:flagellar hook-associated protein 1 FlgK